jgi:hypothetical protein
MTYKKGEEKKKRKRMLKRRRKFCGRKLLGEKEHEQDREGNVCFIRVVLSKLSPCKSGFFLITLISKN